MRDRATAVVRRDGQLLLVRDRGFRHFSLPGGGVQRGETPEQAVIRELAEETSLHATSVRPLPQCRTTDIFNTYSVFLVDATGEVRIDPIELAAAEWWDGKQKLPLFSYVRFVVARLDWPL
ncbi:MAG: NUDIX hydrolase [Dehalococcoidia bacterium]|nr:NUDIX hydrolase [Dehalococcoidia bacterium]